MFRYALIAFYFSICRLMSSFVENCCQNTHQFGGKKIYVNVVSDFIPSIQMPLHKKCAIKKQINK